MNSFHASVPSENWDDDFEFQPTQQSKQTIASHVSHRMSIASSHFTDWDAAHDVHEQDEQLDDQDDQNDPEDNTIPHTILEDKKNLSNWADHPVLPSSASTTHQQPQTPTRRVQLRTNTENWDDDFEVSPVRATTSTSVSASPAKSFPPPPQTKSPSKRGRRKTGQPEGWDDELSGTTNKNLPTSKRRPNSFLTSDDDVDSEMGFGFGDSDGEEDKTVTARSRRAALSKLTASGSNTTPPPPVPSLPPSFLVSSGVSKGSEIRYLDSSNSHPQTFRPFPQSPSASVFSLQTSNYRPPSSGESRSNLDTFGPSQKGQPFPAADTYTYARPPSSAYTVTSTTYLRPTMSRSSSRLDALPPSPPIHRERERRRLRKKSRPQHSQGAIELQTLRWGSMDVGSDGETELPSQRFAERTPSPEHTTQDLNMNNAGPADLRSTSGELNFSRSSTSPPASGVPPSTPNGKAGAILSRIGSVKRWGVRRKRGGSMTPAETLTNADGVRRTDTPPNYQNHDLNLTPRPRPHSQASSSFPSSGSESHSSNNHNNYHSQNNHYGHGHSHKRPATASPPNNVGPSNWFFRSSSSPLSDDRVFQTNSSSNSDLSLHAERGFLQFPSSHHPPDNSAKLVKRKSLGFVQLRRGFGGHGDDTSRKTAAGLPLDERENPRRAPKEEKGKRPSSVQPDNRQASYAGLGIGRATPVRENASSNVTATDPIPNDAERIRARSDEQNDEKEGNRSFMGSVRKLSLVGRHKRTKSGVSLSGVEELASVREPQGVFPLQKHFNLQDYPDRERTPKPRDKENDSKSLLPPIELQPPSPPRANLKASTSAPLPVIMGTDSMLSPGSSSASLNASPTHSASSKTSSKRTKTPGSPQAASLGRSTVGPGSGVGVSSSAFPITGNTGPVLRRNSLGDLKIPDRISQAQVGLKRDLGMVREFAASVEQLRELHLTYRELVAEVQGILDAHIQKSQHQAQAQPRAISPNFLQNLSRPMSRHRSNTNTAVASTSTTPSGNATTQSNSSMMAYKQLASLFYTINSKYRISWECAELLIELGGGSGDHNEKGHNAPPTSTSAPVVHGSAGTPEMRKPSRERAVTLAGDESKPPTPTPGLHAIDAGVGIRAVSPPIASPPSLAWRASTGRHDLSHRQLVLLKEMLHNNESTTSFTLEDPGSKAILEEPLYPHPGPTMSVNREWRWGDAMNSTVTLPSEDSNNVGMPHKKRRNSRIGMSGLRDMLRALKRSHTENPPLPPAMMPPTSSTLSSADNPSVEHHYPHPHVPPSQGRRRAKTSSGPESVRIGRATSPYGPPSLSSKPSPRRPSLASIFRLGQKNKASSSTSDVESGDNVSRSQGSSRKASGHESNSSAGEEDWDRIDSISDLDAAGRALGLNPDGSATVRGKGLGHSTIAHDSFIPPLPSRPLTPKRSVSGSHSPMWGEESPLNSLPPTLPVIRSTRLSNVEENTDDQKPATRSSSRSRHGKVGVSPSRLSSKTPKNGSVRSMPPQSASSVLPDPKLAMTPDNIKPLLENAKEVEARLNECIAEIRSLLAAHSS